MVEGAGGGSESAVAGGSSVAAGGRRYGVRAAEVAMQRALSVIRVEVILLDDSPQVFEIQVGPAMGGVWVGVPDIHSP